MKLTETIDTEYKDVAEKEALKIKKTNNPVLDKLIETCFQTLDSFACITQQNSFQRLLFLRGDLYGSGNTLLNLPEIYRHALKALSEISYTQEDITSFCTMSPLFLEHKNNPWIGTFISALINMHFAQTKTNKTYIIPVNSFSEPVHYLGISNKATYVNISGRVGTNLGHKMEQGRISVNGNADNYVGKFKRGGFLNINGSCGDYLGHHMTGGMIRVTNNAGENVGEELMCGTIYVGGKIKSIGKNKTTGEISAGGIKVFERR